MPGFGTRRERAFGSCWRAARSRPLVLESTCSALARLRRTDAGRPSSPMDRPALVTVDGTRVPLTKVNNTWSFWCKIEPWAPIEPWDDGHDPGPGLGRRRVLLSAPLEVPSGKSRVVDPFARRGRQPVVPWSGAAPAVPSSGSLGASEAVDPEAASAESSPSAAGASGRSSASAAAAAETPAEAAARRRLRREAWLRLLPPGLQPPRCGRLGADKVEDDRCGGAPGVAVPGV